MLLVWCNLDHWCNVESSQWYFKYIYGYKQHLMNFRLMFRSSIGLYQLSLAHFVSRRFPRSLNRSKSSGTMAMSGVNSGSEDLSSSFLTLEKIDVNIYRYYGILKETVKYRYSLLLTRYTQTRSSNTLLLTFKTSVNIDMQLVIM